MPATIQQLTEVAELAENRKPADRLVAALRATLDEEALESHFRVRAAQRHIQRLPRGDPALARRHDHFVGRRVRLRVVLATVVRRQRAAGGTRGAVFVGRSGGHENKERQKELHSGVRVERGRQKLSVLVL